MADADEDVIPRIGAGGEDTDLSDETQDFRFLTSISRQDATIPKRGEKDFEPHDTALQSNTLAASRQAMHNALSFQREHIPKAHMVGHYHPELNMAYIMSPKGTIFSRMGHVFSAKENPFGEDDADRGKRIWLLPEEALYSIERGTVDLRWPVAEGDGESDIGLPMSLQAAYAMFIGDGSTEQRSLTIERYSVYTALKRLGYIVMRAPSWNGPGTAIGSDCYAPQRPRSWQVGLLNPTNLLQRFFFPANGASKSEKDGPVIASGVYRDYTRIYSKLALVNFHDPSASMQPTELAMPTTDPNFRITYHVWKPGNTTFKKSAPGEPDFRIAVVNARETTVPSLEQLSALMDTTPYNPPNPTGHFYQKLKHGYKNVILAVVDQGMTSYLRIADAGFGCEKIYTRESRGGNKRGGRGGGRGRGRGRGR